MALLVGHGYSEERVLGLTLPCFDALVRTVLRVRREELAETARAMMIATQGTAKGLDEWLGGLLGTGASESRKNGKIATAADVLGKVRRG